MFRTPLLLALTTLALAIPVALSAEGNRGLGVASDPLAGAFDEPVAVRHGTAVPGEEIAILRTFRIRKGHYDEFQRRSALEIWPFFEKIGARVVGMWRVDPAAIDASVEKDYDEVVLLTRYASLEHWRATRRAIELGGNGPDARAMADAHAYRQSVTLETRFRVLRDGTSSTGPYYLPPAP